MTILYIDDYMKEKIEKLRKIMGEYFSYDPQIFEDVQKETNERIILDALHFAIEYFEEQEKEINQD